MNPPSPKRLFFQALVAAVGFALLASPALAYPYYYPWYRPVDTLSPSGAALGPWPWNFNFGGGPMSIPNGSNSPLTPGYNFNVGMGYNFTPRVGLDLEFLDAGFGLTQAAVNQAGAIDGDAHIWSVTLNPIYRFRLGGPFGAYIIGGGGYYEEDIRYTDEVQVFVPRYYGYYTGQGLEDVYQDTGYGGLNAGAGLTWNLGWGTKLYVEARYHYIFSPGVKTEIIPVTIGLRW
jgi:opacity protein-like surface antigen